MNTNAYFTRDEVVIHNSQDDIWVVVNGLVLELTSFFEKRLDSMNDNIRLLLQFAGKDLSWAFNDAGEPLRRIDQHVQSISVFLPVEEKESVDSDFWWCDQNNVIGKITCIERRIRIINTLTRKIISMNVCEEDSINVIQRKYSKRFNRNAAKYAWRKTCSNDENSGRLFMDKTLAQNQILYEKNEKMGLLPAIWLYFVLNKN